MLRLWSLWCLGTLNYARFYFSTFACNFFAFSYQRCFYLFSPSFRLWELLFLEGRQKHAYGEEKKIPLSLYSSHSLLFPLYSFFFLLTWQRDNPSRFTSSEFTFTTFRTTYLILKSYMAVWYHSRMSGISAFPEGCDAFTLQTSGLVKARSAGDFVGQRGT